MLEAGTSLPKPCQLQCTIRRKTQQAELPTTQEPPDPLPQQQQHQHGTIHHLQSTVNSSSPDSKDNTPAFDVQESTVQHVTSTPAE